MTVASNLAGVEASAYGAYATNHQITETILYLLKLSSPISDSIFPGIQEANVASGPDVADGFEVSGAPPFRF
jgi:hypothetical protein